MVRLKGEETSVKNSSATMVAAFEAKSVLQVQVRLNGGQGALISLTSIKDLFLKNGTRLIGAKKQTA